ncbi:MAG: hypothetical protein SFU91_01135 [Chloroherpetonaceae bacterium]|nr:hypothetical protein [Chloroherpetonaceae bacterium]
MKRIVLSVLVLLTFALTSCDNGTKELTQSKAQIESLQQELTQYSTQFEDVNKQKQALEASVSELATSANQLKLLLPNDPKKAYSNDITGMISGIKDKIESQNATISKLQGEVSRLKSVLAEKEKALTTAYKKIDSLTSANESLKKANEKLLSDIAEVRKKAEAEVEAAQQKIRDLEGQLFIFSRAFYVVNNAGGLRKIGVLDGTKLNPAFNLNENRDQFEVVDKNKTTEIVVATTVKDVKLWTPHLKGSYEVVADPTDPKKSIIKILQNEEFWMMTNYLVVGNDG